MKTPGTGSCNQRSAAAFETAVSIPAGIPGAYVCLNLEEKLKTIGFRFFIGEQVWYRSMNRIGEVVECSFSRDYGYRYTVRIAYQGQWQDETCDEAQLLLASERIDLLFTRRITPDGSPCDYLPDMTDARTGQ
jgi:hypothetical protein